MALTLEPMPSVLNRRSMAGGLMIWSASDASGVPSVVLTFVNGLRVEIGMLAPTLFSSGRMEKQSSAKSEHSQVRYIKISV